MAKKNDLPSLHFYPGDWWKDPGVKMLTHEEKGVWFEMILLMFDSKDRGKLTMNGQPMTDEMISFALNLLPEKGKQIVSKLIAYDVCSLEHDTNIIYSRRMVRDEELSIIRKNSGHLGGIKKKENDLLRQNSSKVSTKTLAPPEDESESENEDVTVFEVIVKDLNLKLGTKYKPTSKKIREKIHVRMAEGFTVDDFLIVNSKKAASWKNDPKMSKYLRPETLYGNKFEGYLNEINAAGQTEADRMKVKHAGAIAFANKVVG